MAELTKEQKLEKIQKTQDDLEKRFGKGITMRGNVRMDVPIICSSGSINIDIAIGVGGIPKGRIIEIYGPESSGKTTTVLSIIAEAQKAGGECAFVDSEHALDPKWATNLGVNMNNVLISQPDCGEDALEVVEALVDSGVFSIIAVDSVAALVPKAELEGDMGDSHMGLQARLMSQAMRKLTAKISKSECTVIFTNQIRMKIGVMFGSPETTTGGNALKFYASIRLDVRRITDESTSDDNLGLSIAGLKIKVVKNKVAPPFKVVHVELNTGVNGFYGYNSFKEVLDLGVKHELIRKAGAWYSKGDERIGQGKDNACTWLRENISTFYEIRDKIFELEFKDNNSEIGSFDAVVEDLKEEKKRRKIEKAEQESKTVVEEV